MSPWRDKLGKREGRLCRTAIPARLGCEMSAEPSADGEGDANPADWDDGALLTKNAIAPAEASGANKFGRMFRHDSPEIAWRVAFKTMRKARTGDERLPSGFPPLWTFFLEARSLRVFKWGFCKYKSLYPHDSGWTRWAHQPDVGEEHPQKLRTSIWTLCDRAQRGVVKESTGLPYVVTPLQCRLLAWTVRAGLWKQVPLEAAPAKIRALCNWGRARASLIAVRFVDRLSRQAKRAKKRPLSPSLQSSPEHDGVDAGPATWGCTPSGRADCPSPSLKRVRV